jgi:hypothetical protein
MNCSFNLYHMADAIQQSHRLAYLQNPNKNYVTSQNEFCRYYDVTDNFSVKERRLLSATYLPITTSLTVGMRWVRARPRTSRRDVSHGGISYLVATFSFTDRLVTGANTVAETRHVRREIGHRFLCEIRRYSALAGARLLLSN